MKSFARHSKVSSVLVSISVAPIALHSRYSYSLWRRFVSNSSSALGIAQGLSIHEMKRVFHWFLNFERIIIGFNGDVCC